MSRRDRFRRAKDGVLVVNMAREEVDLLHQLATELGELVADPAIDETVANRLFPRAYLDPTEEDAEGEWQRLVHPDLVAGRLAALQLLTATLPAEPDADWIEARLDEEAEGAWLGVLNDARLALGTRLGVTEDDDLTAVPATDPDFYARHVYLWLSALQEDLVQALLASLPEHPDSAAPPTG